MDHPLENKNTIGAVEIIEKIKQKYPQIKVMCFGLSRFHKMPGYIEFYENPDEDTIVKLYCDSDIFLFTSKYEGFGGPPAGSHGVQMRCSRKCSRRFAGVCC